MPIARVKISDIRPNPFRHIDQYPILREKVDYLRRSFQSTGYWGNIVARPVNGKCEIAFGHHRLQAMREEYGEDPEVDILVRELDDQDMLRMMANENMDGFGSSATVRHLAIRAVVEAYAEGKIELRAPDPKTHPTAIRYAPSFVAGDVPRAPGGRPYSALSVAEFLGWVKPSGEAQAKVRSALTALSLIEDGIMTEAQFEGLSTRQAEAVIRQTAKAKRDDEKSAEFYLKTADSAAIVAKNAEDDGIRLTAKRRETTSRKRGLALRERSRLMPVAIAERVSAAMKDGVSYREAPKIAAEAMPKPAPALQGQIRFLEKLCFQIDKILRQDSDKNAGQLEMIIKVQQDLDPLHIKETCDTLRRVSARAERFVERLEEKARALNGAARLLGRLPVDDAKGDE
jgi:hypothetical protein